MAGMYADQMNRAKEFTQQIQREVRLTESDNGYSLLAPSEPERLVGFVRYNVAGCNARRFAVYAYYPFVDDKVKFQNCQEGQRNDGWHIFIDPVDQATVQYAVKVLESAWDYRMKSNS